MTQDSKVVFRVDTDEAKAVAGFLKLIDKERQVEDQTERVNKALKRQGTTGDKTAKSLMSIAKAGLAFAGVTTAADMVTRALDGIIDRMETLNEISNRTAVGIRDFVALQPNGQKGQDWVREVVGVGAKKYGLTADEVGALAQPIQSLTDFDSKGGIDSVEELKAFWDAFNTAAKLVNQGIDPEVAKGVVASGLAKGVAASVMGDQLIAASDLSAMGPAQLATALPMGLNYSSPDLVLAAASAFTQEETNAGKLPALIEQLGRVTGKATEGEGIQKKYGLAGLSEIEKWQKLADIGDQEGKGDTREARIADWTASSLKEAGVGSSEEQKALGIIIRQLPFLESVLASMENSAGLLDQKQANLEAHPILAHAMMTDRAAAVAQFNAAYGTQGDVQRDMRQEYLASGAELQADGYGGYVNPESGAPDWRAATWQAIRSTPGPWGFQPPGGDAAERFEAATSEIVGALTETNALLREAVGRGGGNPLGSLVQTVQALKETLERGQNGPGFADGLRRGGNSG